MTIQHTTRRGLPYPDTARPDSADVPRDVAALAIALDNAPEYDQGILANRPISTTGTPGRVGRMYFVQGDSTSANNGILWLDYGTGWLPVGYIADGSITDIKIAAANIDGLPSVPSLRTLGTGAQQAMAGNDTRIRNVLARLGEVEWVSTALEKSLLAGGVVVPAGSLGTDKSVAVRILGDYFNNTGSARTLRMRVLFGGVVVFDAISGNISGSAGKRAFDFDLVLSANASATSQRLGGSAEIGAADVPATGVGGFAEAIGTTQYGGPIAGIATTVDTTADQTLDVLVTHSVSHGSLSIKRYSARVTVV